MSRPRYLETIYHCAYDVHSSDMDRCVKNIFIFHMYFVLTSSHPRVYIEELMKVVVREDVQKISKLLDIYQEGGGVRIFQKHLFCNFDIRGKR